MKVFKKIRIFLFGMNKSDLVEYNYIAKTYLKESLQYVLDNTICPAIGIDNRELLCDGKPSNCPIIQAIAKSLLHDIPLRFDLMVRHESAEIAVEELFDIVYETVKAYELKHFRDCDDRLVHGQQICNDAKEFTFQKLRAAKIA